MVCPEGLASARYLRAVIPGREIRNTASSSTRAAVTHLASRETQAGCSSSNTGSSCCSGSSCGGSGCSSGSCSLRPNLTNAVHTKKVRCLAEPTMFLQNKSIEILGYILCIFGSPLGYSLPQHPLSAGRSSQSPLLLGMGNRSCHRSRSQ